MSKEADLFARLDAAHSGIEDDELADLVLAAMTVLRPPRRVYLASSQEPTWQPDGPLSWSVVVVGVFSTRELAQEALEKRVKRFRGITLLMDWQVAAIGGLAVTSDLACQWSRYLSWASHPHADGFWQLVEIREVDHAF